MPGKIARVKSKLGVFAVFVIALLATHAYAGGDFLNSEPGDLSKSHGALDDPNHCSDCHVDGTKDIVDQKCLDCHDHNPLRDRISGGKGFHASPLVKGKRCQTCHTEHHGRGFDIMGWKNLPGGQKGFDRTLTGWRSTAGTPRPIATTATRRPTSRA